MLAGLVNPKKQCVPAWSGFNESVCLSKSVLVTKVGHLPIINAPAHDNDVIWTVTDRCQKMTHHLGQKFTGITFDEQLHSKAKMLQWFRPDECKNLIIMLGGFHTQIILHSALASTWLTLV